MMKTSFFDQVTKVVSKHAKRSRWVPVVLCLALVVSTGTFYTLIRQGQAKVRSEKLLVCDFVPHEHTDDCFGRDEFGEIDESVILCGMEDFVIHTHTDDCYDADGHLVCTLEEIEAHEHTDECYEEVLICDHVEQAGGHQHTDECYEERVITDEAGTEPEAPAEAGNACTQEEHTHTDACYTEEETTGGDPVLTCTESEHTHDDSCYTEKTELTCSEGEHTHDDSCYTPIYSEELTCSSDEEGHEHDSGCYSQVQTGTELTCGQNEHSHGDGCYETVRELTCGQSEHTHGDSCYSAAEAGTHKVLTCGKTEHTHDANCAGSDASGSDTSDTTAAEPKTERVLICGKEENVPEEVHHDESCYERVLICGKEEHIPHEHDESCYREPREGEEDQVVLDEEGNELGILICDKPVLLEHIHNKDCFVKVTVGVEDPQYICGKLSHTHEDGCYGIDEATGERVLRCPLEEHTHGDTCLASAAGNWICGKEAHKHDDSCLVNGELACGLEEHEHSDECLPEPEWLCGKIEHKHDETCYNADGELVCPLEEHTHTGLCMTANAAPDWKCGKIAHTHGDDCRNEAGELTCELPEHEHTDFCLLDPETTAWLCGKTAHAHGDGCYDENGVLTCELEVHEHTPECLVDHDIEWFCGKTEHTHGPACYAEDGVTLVCTLEEHTHDKRCLVAEIKDEDCICGISAHTHGDDCYDADGNLTCDLEEHVHTIDCLAPDGIEWLCGKIAHTHGDNCYDADGNLICGLEEHLHTAACLVKQDDRWLCGKTEHKHGDDCYDADGNLICDLEEHEHSDLCLLVPETIMVKHDHNYTTTSGYFDITFNVEGPAILRRDPASMGDNEPAEEVVPVEDEEDYEVFLFDGDESESTDEPAAPEETDTAEPAPEETETDSADDTAAPEDSGHEFRFQVDDLEKTSDSYLRFLQTAEENSENLLDALSVKLYCDDQMLDLTDCKITATLHPTALLRELLAQARAEAAAAKAAEEENAVLAGVDEDADGEEPAATTTLPNPEDIVLNISVRGIKEDSVDTLGTTTINETAEPDDEIATLAGFGEADEAEAESAEGGNSEMAEGSGSEDVTTENGTFEEADPEGGSSDGIVSDEVFGEDTSNGSAPMEDGMRNDITVNVDSNGEMGISENTGEPDKFTVQYYANLDRLVTDKYTKADSTAGYSPVPMYDTHEKGGPPSNNDTMSTYMMHFYSKNGTIGAGTENEVLNGSVLYKKELTRIFEDDTLPFSETTDVTLDTLDHALNTLLEHEGKRHYDLAEVWILKNGKTVPTDAELAKMTDAQIEAKNKEIWDVKTAAELSGKRFTNDENDVASHPDEYIQLRTGATVRLVYEPTDAMYRNDALFYDYDISDGGIYSSATSTAKIDTDKQSTQTGTVYAKVYQQGINAIGNYSGNGSAKLAFGNRNVATGLTEENVEGRYINKANGSWNTTKNILEKCYFGLTTGLTNGQLNFSVKTPPLFQEGAVESGKSEAFDANLNFKRYGDTYTLSSVNGDNAKVSNLERIRLSADTVGRTGQAMFSNYFWPMDASETWGAKGHDLKFGDRTKEAQRKYGNGANDKFPISDEVKTNDDKAQEGDHNAYFGMHSIINFQLTEKYVGPLEYIFYGDDDMWVYLEKPDGTTTLICDIGGVHQPIGEYVDLWDYLGNETFTGNAPNKYKLHIFYLERGASGSTCWMQFTLPQVTSVTPPPAPGKTTAKLTVEKKVEGSSETEFEFNLYVPTKDSTAQNPKYETTTYNYTRYKEDKVTTYTAEEIAALKQPTSISGSGGSFFLKDGEYIVIHSLPKDRDYKITEVGAPGYQLTTETTGASTNGSDATGNVGTGTSVVLVNKPWPQMPATGGPGTTAFSIAGAALVVGGLLFAGRKRRRED